MKSCHEKLQILGFPRVKEYCPKCERTHIEVFRFVGFGSPMHIWFSLKPLIIEENKEFMDN